MGKYEALGSGLSDAATRKKLYTAAIVVAVLIVGIRGRLFGLVAAALARANVDPPKQNETDPRTVHS